MIHSFKLGWEQGVPIYTQAYRLSGCLQCFLRACVHRHLPASFRQILLHTALKILARHQVCLRIFALSATKFARKSAHISYEHKLLKIHCQIVIASLQQLFHFFLRGDTRVGTGAGIGNGIGCHFRQFVEELGFVDDRGFCLDTACSVVLNGLGNVQLARFMERSSAIRESTSSSVELPARPMCSAISA